MTALILNSATPTCVGMTKEKTGTMKEKELMTVLQQPGDILRNDIGLSKNRRTYLLHNLIFTQIAGFSCKVGISNPTTRRSQIFTKVRPIVDGGRYAVLNGT